MDRGTSLLEVFSLVVVSARGRAAARAGRSLYCRSELMLMQLRAGRTPCAELVAEGALTDMHELLPPRGQRATHASYRVTSLDGSVLNTCALLPRRRGVHMFRLRVRHPDGSVDRLRPIESDGLVTEAPLTIRLRPGTTVVEIEGGGRIDVHWDGPRLSD